MKPPAITAPEPRTWRDLPQPIKPRAMSREGRKRRVLAAAKSVLAVATLLAVGWGGTELIAVLKKNPARLAAPANSAPVRSVVLRTDGVLDEAWARETLVLAPKVGLMTLDLAALQARLLAGGQVQAAELTRRLPDTLLVTLHERAPVARVMTQAGDDTPRPLLVAQDGTVFDGRGYAPETVEQLPWLDGVKLKKSGPGLAPIRGMDAVADLMLAVRTHVPELARRFRVVSLARLEADGVLVVTSDDVGEVVFGARGNLARQAAQLDYTLAATRRQFPVESLRVNLAVGGGQVLVARLMAEPPAGRPAPVRRADGTAGVTGFYFPTPKPSVNFSHAL